MPREPQLTAPVLKVVSALLANPDTDRYGMQLMRDTGLASGTLYPILVRLERAGWVQARWDDVDPVAVGRPSRRYYRLTPHGVAVARREIASMYQQMARVTGQPGLAAQ